MVIKDVVVRHPHGLYAHQLCLFVQMAINFECSVYVTRGNHRVNAKSLLAVLTLAVVQNTKITIITDGLDEEEAARSLVQLIEDNFDEKK